jgi:hypothetical protein
MPVLIEERYCPNAHSTYVAPQVDSHWLNRPHLRYGPDFHERNGAMVADDTIHYL